MKVSVFNIVFINYPPNTDEDFKLLKITSILLQYYNLSFLSTTHNEIML